MKKGFTLVELLGVIAIIGVMALITFPIIINNLRSTSKVDYEKFLKNLYLATESYLESDANEKKLNEPGDFAFIELQELVKNEFLNKKMVNPLTKKPVVLTNTILVKVLNDYTKSYEFTGTDASLRNYHSNNLKIHYDGYYKPAIVNNKLIWADLYNNANGEIINGNGVIDWYENKIKLGNIDNYILSINSSQIIQTASDVTIEIVYEIINNENTTKLRTKGLGLYYFDLYNDGLIRSMVRNAADTANYWPTATEKAITSIGEMHTLTVTMKSKNETFDFQYYGDGKKLAMSSINGKKHGNDNFKIGQDYQSGLKSNVYIYGFRVYDRALTDEEVIKNYNIDKNRYDWRKS